MVRRRKRTYREVLPGYDVPSPSTNERLRKKRRLDAPPSIDDSSAKTRGYDMTVVIQRKDLAILTARETEIPTGVACPGGYAVVTRNYESANYGYSGKTFLVQEAYAVAQVEKMGITEALAAAVHEVEQRAPFSSFHTLEQQQQFARVGMGGFDRAVVRVFVDSQDCLTQIAAGIHAEPTGNFDQDFTRPIDIRIVELSKRLAARGCVVELHWIPRSSTDEHVLADGLSRGARVGTSNGHHIMVAESSSETTYLDEEVRKATELFLAKQALLMALEV
ncbi:hypothetical protein V8F06_011837 [Rhypophila decipiens]